MSYMCERCKTKMRVSNTRTTKAGILRYRYCSTCPARVVTVEIPADEYRELLKAKEVKDE